MCLLVAFALHLYVSYMKMIVVATNNCLTFVAHSNISLNQYLFHFGGQSNVVVFYAENLIIL